MEKEFIPYKQALELKELQFDEPCLSGYSKSTEKLEFYSRPLITKDSFTVDAPTFSQIFRWFRKNHGLYSSIIFKKSYPDNHVTGLEWYIIICGGDGVLFDTDGTYTYEEAELACLKKLIEIVNSK